MCNPINFDNYLTKNNFDVKIIFEQNRSLDPNLLNDLSEGLSEYFIKLSNENKCMFEIENKMKWNYKVWLKKINSNI